MWGAEALEWLPAWLGYSVAVCLLVYLWGIWPYMTTSIDLPGPKPTPFLGNMLQLTKQGAIQSDMAYSKKYGQAYLTWFGRKPIINVSDPDMVKQICVKQFPSFTDRGALAPLSHIQKSGVLFQEGERWKFVRSILSPTFTSGKLRQMGPILDVCLKKMSTNLLGYSKTGESFDVKAVMGGLTMEVIGAVGFGIQTDTQKDLNNEFIYYAKRTFEANALRRAPVIISTVFPFMKPVCEALGLTTEAKEFNSFAVDMLTKVIQERRIHPLKRKDLLQLIMDSSVDDLKQTLPDKDVDVDALKLNNAVREKGLNDLDIISQIILFLLAAYDTTSSALAFLAYHLAVHPEYQEKLIQEIDEALHGAPPTYDNVMTLPYLDKCLCETQRLYPALRGTTRISGEAVTVKGLHIPANTFLILQGYVIQHDERHWPDSNKFDPERWSPEQKSERHPFAYFPFGVGPRNCVGMRLALMEAKMAAVTILQKFRFLRAPETQVPLTLGKGIFVQADGGLLLRVESRG